MELFSFAAKQNCEKGGGAVEREDRLREKEEGEVMKQKARKNRALPPS
jgi:hypothetical protein